MSLVRLPNAACSHKSEERQSSDMCILPAWLHNARSDGGN